MVAPSAPRDARSKTPPGPEGSNGIDRCGRRGQPAGSPPFGSLDFKLPRLSAPVIHWRKPWRRLWADRCGRSVLARMQPGGVAFGVTLVLPDRHARLGRIDDPAAGLESGIAVRGPDADPDRQIANREFAKPVHATRIDD